MIGAGLAGKTALVTGTAHGIGAAIAAALRDEGATVYGIDRLDVDDIVDVSNQAEVDRFVAGLPSVDILVNNAGGVVGQTHRPIEEITDEAWRAVIDANLTSAFVCTRAVASRMKANGWGRIVNISSGAGRSVSLTGIQAYTSAKAGQIGFTRQMAYELGPFGITVNCIAPGFVLSNPTTEKQWDSYGADGQAELVQGIALRRLGSADDIAGGVRWFTSELASWVTGQVISIDGGHALF
jgi:3-oxoacyl-[acyl-carrier protein] reductase